MGVSKTCQYRSIHADTMSTQFTKETLEIPKKGWGKDGTGQSKIKRTDIFGKRWVTGEDT